MIILKRDILIFPKFDNITLIEKVRKEHDNLYSILPPHITIVFPFVDNITNLDLFNKLSDILKDFECFDVTFSGVNLSDDNYIFLNCTKGKENIIKLHDLIYSSILPSHLNKNIPFIPHITLGPASDISFLKNFNYEFSTNISEISIEIIGENEESIIYKNIKLKKI